MLPSSYKPSIPPPKAPKIPALESFDSFQKKSDSNEVDSTTFSPIYPRLHPSNSASKYTTSSLDNLLETYSESTIRQPPRHRYNLRNNRHPTPSLASSNSSLSTDSFSLPDNALTSGVDTAFSQRSSISSYNESGHLFSRPTAQNSNVLSSDSHLPNFDLTTDRCSTPPTPNRADYPLSVTDTLVNSPRQDPRYLDLANQKFNSNPIISNERRRKEFQRLDTTILEMKFEITAKFHN